MRKPRLVKLQVLGIYQNDEENYFSRPEDYEDTQLLFPLNKYGNAFCVPISRLDFFIKKHYIKEGNQLNGKLILLFYNYEKQQFVEMDELFNSQTNLVDLNEEYVPQDQVCPLIIKVKVQLFYHEFRKIKQFLENIQQQKQIFEETIQQEKNELSKQTEVLNQFQSELQSLKQLYPIKITYPEVDVAFLYSHPIKKYNEALRVKPVSYFQEISEIKQKIKEEKKKLKCLITCATEENLREALKYNPKIIHIMSHGDKNNEKGYYLEFENECLSHQVPTDQIQKIFGARKDLQLVILSSCHSGEIAQRLKNYAPTIAVQAQLKMGDEASIYYTAALYQQLLKKKSLEESHNIAKKETVDILRDNIFSCCCSHAHNKTCLYTKFAPCLPHNYDCNCINRLYLKHKWELNNKCSIRSLLYSVFEGKELEIVMQKLDRYGQQNNGEIKVCCCEISDLLLNDDDEFESIEHNESEKFQIFSQMPTNEEILNEAEEGMFTVVNEFALEEEYDFVGWLQDIVTVYKQLGEQIYAKDRQIIILYLDGEYRPKIQSVIKEFALKVSKYFIEREIKLHRSHKKKVIKALSYSLKEIDNVNDQLDPEYNYIFIITEVEYSLFKEKQEKIKILNKKGAMIVTADKELRQNGDQNFYFIQLLDWNKKNDSPNLLKIFLQDTNLRKKFEAKYNESEIQDLPMMVIKRIDEFLENENAKV